MPCAERKEEINGIKTDIVGIKVEIAGIHITLSSTNYALSAIKSWIMKKDNTMIGLLSEDLSLTKKNSPMALSELGHEGIKIIDGMKFIEDHKDFLFDLIDKEAPNTALDVGTSAYSVCFSATGDDIFILIQNIIYHTPPIKIRNKNGEQEDFNIDIFNVCSVLSIPLRDMYLLEHPSLLEQLQGEIY